MEMDPVMLDMVEKRGEGQQLTWRSAQRHSRSKTSMPVPAEKSKEASPAPAPPAEQECSSGPGLQFSMFHQQGQCFSQVRDSSSPRSTNKGGCTRSVNQKPQRLQPWAETANQQDEILPAWTQEKKVRPTPCFPLAARPGATQHPMDALGGAAPRSGQSAGQRPGQTTDGSHGAAPSDAGRKDPAAEQDLAKEILLGIRAVEPPEEHEITDEVQLGLKVSSSAWARRGPLQVQTGPEEDHDHLYHPQDNAGEASARGPPPRMLSLEVQSGPEEDRDHLHHG
ncbi:proline-rich acidic protein 1 isoform 1-T1 [Alca torda]